VTLTRRQFLLGSGALAGLGVFAPLAGRVGAAFGATNVDPATALRRRLVVIYQQGGNDGLNMVSPRGDVAGAPRYSVYRKVRPSIGHDRAVTLPLDRVGDAGWDLGLHPRLQTVHRLYGEGRVAVVQGVDYPSHNYSHFESTDIWQSGLPESSFDSGWIGRHLDRAGIGEGELRAVGLGNELPLALRGQKHQGVEISGLPLAFSDGTDAIADPRHAALRSFGTQLWPAPLARFAADQVELTVATVEDLERAPAPVSTGNPLANDLLAARTLLTENLGVEVVFVQQGGYDTHAGQLAQHDTLFSQLDGAIEAFFLGTLAGADLGIGPLPPGLADRTLVMTTSEFGRRIGETGVGASVAGTDHGAAAPMLLIGPSTGLVPGVHGDHPDMGSVLLPADNLAMTTDLRRVYQSILQQWLGDPDPNYAGSFDPLPGLFPS
jgi:uncharacterized protein (DUF1501 family)